MPEAVADELNRLWTFARVFSNTAHELNNGLQIIAGQAEMLGLICNSADAQRRLREIVSAVTRSAADLDGLLRYARLEPARPHAQDVAPMVRACVQMRAASLARRRITLTAPELPDRCRAVVDVAWFMQLLLDLLLACEEAAARGRAASIAVAAQPLDRALRVQVGARWQDAAEPSTDRPRLEPGGGSLSLVVARRLAERLGARLRERREGGLVDFELDVPAPPA
jgi:signal transduction histidine kinase